MNRPTQLKLGNDLIWKIQLKDLPENPPSIHIKVNNDAATFNTTTDYTSSSPHTYSITADIEGLAEGDQVHVTETVEVGQEEYTNTWVAFVSLPERGTDSEEPEDGIEFLVTVQNDNMDVLAGALVQVTTKDGQLVSRKLTIEDGTIKFNLPPNEFIFTVVGYVGYAPFEPQIEEVSEQNTSAVLILETDDTSTQIDLTGIKRVKTRNMEIEVFDPEKMQKVRAREQGRLPNFCDSHFCIGVHTNEKLSK